MSATRPLYDLVLLLDTAAEDSRRQEILQAAETTVTKGGELVNKQDWGPRQMAFEIKHRKDADYHLLQFHGSPELLAQLDRQLRIVDEVVRFRIIKLAPGTPPPPDQRAEPRPAGIAAAADEVAPEGDPAEDAAPQDAVPADAAPQDAAPVEEAPVEDAPVEDAAPVGDVA